MRFGKLGLGFGGDEEIVTLLMITSSNVASVFENATLAKSLAANLASTWTITGGVDQARFEISGSTLRWLSNGTKNYESPNDSNADNIYVVDVRATSGAQTADQTISVTVLNANEAPTDIAWAGSHVIAENAELGTSIGGVLSFSDPDAGATGTFSVVEGFDGGGLVGISGTQPIVTGVFDYELYASHDIKFRFTDQGGLTYDETFTLTVTDVDETPPEAPLPPGDIVVDDPVNFEVIPYVTEVEGAFKIAGKNKTGSSAKFVHDIGAFVPGQRYLIEYDPDFSLLADDGVSVMVGFLLRHGNDFHLVGLKGNGASGINAYKVLGANKWNATSGFSEDNGGAPAYGTQAGPNFIQLETSADGHTITFQTASSVDGPWTDEYSAYAPSPFSDADEATTFGLGAFFPSTSSGPFTIKVTRWIEAELAIFDTLHKGANVTLSGSDKTATLSGIGNVLGNAPMLADTYFEVEVVVQSVGVIHIGAAFQQQVLSLIAPTPGVAGSTYGSNGSAASPLNVTYTTGDRIGVAYRPSTAEFWFRKNGSWLGNDPSGAAAVAGNTTLATRPLFPFVGCSAGGGASVQLKTATAEFENPAPSGFSPLVSASRPANRWSTVDKGANLTVSGNGSIITKSSTGHHNARMVQPVEQGVGEVYAIKVSADGAGSTAKSIGVTDRDDNLISILGASGFAVGYRSGGTVVRAAVTLHTYTAWGAVNDVVMIALKRSTNEIWFGLNGTWNGDPAAGTGEISAVPADGSTENYWFVAAGSTDSGDAFTFIPYPYTVPSGFVAQNPP